MYLLIGNEKDTATNMKEKKAEILTPHGPFPSVQLCHPAGLTCLSLGAHAREGGHSVNAGGARCAGGEGAVVDVLTAVVSTPAIDAHAGVASIAVGTGASVLTGVGLQQALVHILRAELSFGGKVPLIRTLRSQRVSTVPAPTHSSS